jgi:hypothetical protein
MPDVFITVTVNQDQEALATIGDIIDSIGRPAKVDGGYKQDGDGDGVSGGNAVIALDPDNADGLGLIYKADLDATEFPATSTGNGYLDVDLGQGVKRLNFITTIITLPAEAVSANIAVTGTRPRTA